MLYNNFIIGSLCAICCEIIYGLSYLFTKNATSHLDMLALLGWRFFVSLLALFIMQFIGFYKFNLNLEKIKNLFPLSFLFPIAYFITETLGITYSAVSECGVFFACIPVASIIASTFILHKRPTKQEIAGVFISLFGVLITIFAVQSAAKFSLLGYFFLTLAVVSFAIYSVFVESVTANYSSKDITFTILLFGSIFFITIAIIDAYLSGNILFLLLLPFQNQSFLTAIIYQGIGCSIFAFFLGNMAISQIGVNRTSTFTGIATVVSIFSGILFLQEEFTKHQVIGAIIVLIGVYIANTKELK